MKQIGFVITTEDQKDVINNTVIYTTKEKAQGYLDGFITPHKYVLLQVTVDDGKDEGPPRSLEDLESYVYSMADAFEHTRCAMDNLQLDVESLRMDLEAEKTKVTKLREEMDHTKVPS